MLFGEGPGVSACPGLLKKFPNKEVGGEHAGGPGTALCTCDTAESRHPGSDHQLALRGWRGKAGHLGSLPGAWL